MLLTMMFLGYMDAVPYKITSIPENTVAVFQPLRNIKQYDQVWNMATFIEMRPYKSELEKLPGLVQKAAELCGKVIQRGPDDCGLAMNLNFLHLEEILEMDRIFPKGGGREKRGLLNVIGTMGKALFGIMDDQDAQYLNERIDDLQTGEEKLMQFGKEQTTIIKSMVDYFNDTSNQLVKQQKAMENNMEKLAEAMTKIQNQVGKLEQRLVILHELNEVIQFVSTKLMMFRSKQRMLVQAVTTVHHQPNVPMLIHPDMLLEQLKNIQQTSSKDVELPIVPERDNLRLYYQVIEPEIAVMPDRLIINFRIPMVERETYTLYHVVNLPVKATDGTYHTLTLNKPYLAVNTRRTKFLELSDTTISSCTEVSGNMSICRHGVTYQLPEHSSCEMDLFVQPEKLGQSCRTTSLKITQSLWFELSNDDSWIFLLPEPIVGKVTGPKEGIFRVSMQGTGKIQLDPGSSMECGGVIFKAPVSTSSQELETIFIRANNEMFQILNSTSEQEAIKLPKVVNLLESGKLQIISGKLKDLEQLQDIPLIKTIQRDQWITWITTAVMVLGITVLYVFFKCWKKNWLRCKKRTVEDEEDSSDGRLSIMTM